MDQSWLIVLDLLGVAIAGGMFVVPLYAFLTTTVPKAETARTIAANNIVNSGFMVAATLILTVAVQAGVTVARQPADRRRSPASARRGSAGSSTSPATERQRPSGEIDRHEQEAAGKGQREQAQSSDSRFERPGRVGAQGRARRPKDGNGRDRGPASRIHGNYLMLFLPR